MEVIKKLEVLKKCDGCSLHPFYCSGIIKRSGKKCPMLKFGK